MKNIGKYLRNLLLNHKYKYFNVLYIGKFITWHMTPSQVVSDFDEYDLWDCITSYTVDCKNQIIKIDMGTKLCEVTI